MPAEPPVSGPRGVLIAAPASGSGKTTVTLALLHRLRREGHRVASVKIGPDYIDPAFHAAASGRTCLNLDPWAMREGTLAAVVRAVGTDADLVVGEGVMGLYDGAPDGAGSTADAARRTGWPVILVVDARGLAASAAPLVHGFHSYAPDVPLAGVVFNHTGGAGHARLLREACAPLGVPVLGCLPRSDALHLPDRHLGLVQAREHPALKEFLEAAADWVGEHLDVAALVDLARPARLAAIPAASPLPPPGQRVAVACDDAFAFAYPLVLDGWRASGAELSTFSPLADEAPRPDADAVYLPGGYPELHAGRLADSACFLGALRAAAERGTAIYGECGGYMVLGEGLVEADGRRHRMAGLLPLETSFAERRLHLGYRHAEVLADGPLGAAGAHFRGHEFHFASVLKEAGAAPLFAAADAAGDTYRDTGLRRGSVMGSFLHLIDCAEDADAAIDFAAGSREESSERSRAAGAPGT